MAFGESTAALGADGDGSDTGEAGDPPTSPVLGPPRRCPPPEKGIKVAVAERDGWDEVSSPDRPASSPSSFPLTAETELCSTSHGGAETSSCGSASVFVAVKQGDNCFSNRS